MLPVWIQAIFGLGPLFAVFWAVYAGRHKITVEDSARRKLEVEDEVTKRLQPYLSEQQRLREQLKEEKDDCREATRTLEDRVDKYETRLHEAESEKSQLGTKVAGLEGQLRTIDRFLPQIDMMIGGRRHADPHPHDLTQTVQPKPQR